MYTYLLTLNKNLKSKICKAQAKASHVVSGLDTCQQTSRPLLKGLIVKCPSLIQFIFCNVSFRTIRCLSFDKFKQINCHDDGTSVGDFGYVSDIL